MFSLFVIEAMFSPGGGDNSMFGLTLCVRDLLKLYGFEKLLIEFGPRLLDLEIGWVGLFFIWYEDKLKKILSVV